MIWNIGDKANWAFTARGGYGYRIVAAAVVVGVTAKRVKIKVARRVPGAWIVETKVVNPKSLSPRIESVPEIDR